MCPSTGCFGHVDNSISGTSSIVVTSTVKILEISWRTPLIFLDLIVKSGSFSNISLQLPASAIRWNQAIGIEIATDRTTKNRMIIFFDFSVSYSKLICKDFWSIRMNHVTYSELHRIFPLRSFILQRWTAQLIERYRSIAITIQNQAVKL